MTHPGTRKWPTATDIVVATAGIVVHVLAAHEYYPLGASLGAGVLFSLTWLAVTRYVRKGPGRLPWVEAFLSLQYAHFGVGVFTAPVMMPHVEVTPDPDSFTLAVWLAVSGAVILLASFALAHHLLSAARVPNLQAPVSRDSLVRAAPVYVVLALGYLAIQVVAPNLRIQVLGTTAAVFDFVLNWPLLVAVSTATVLLAPSLTSRILVVAAVGLVLAETFRTSVLANGVFSILGGALVTLRIRGRIPLLPVALALSLFMLLQPYKGSVRNQRWGESASDVGVIEAWQTAVAESEDEAFSTEKGAQRASELSSFAYTVQVVPDVVSHTGGRAYQVVVQSFVPRVLWPNKPDLTKAGVDPFLIELGIQTEEAARTSTTGISIMAHGFLEHGLPGALGWMGLVGIALAFCASLFRADLVGTICGTPLVVGWIYGAGSGFVGFFGSLWQAVVAGILAGWVLHFLGARRVTTRMVARSGA